MDENKKITERQRRELEYHKAHAELNVNILERPFSYDVVLNQQRRWWNANWEMYTYLLDKGLNGQKVLVVGCGFGDDALKLAKVGAKVKAFDLSPESLQIARKLAIREKLDIDFEQMAAEQLKYSDDYFDFVVARDILHHVEITEAMNEIVRVSKKGAIFCFNEVYSHSITDRIRNSKFIDRWLYPKMTSYVYEGEKPYITEDERKLTEKDINQILASMMKPDSKKYFNFIVTRLVPKKYLLFKKIDRALLILFSPISYLLGGRIMVGGKLKQ